MRVNFIFPRPSVTGGMQSNGLIAEALVKRGHDVAMYFVDAPRPAPPITQPRRFAGHVLRSLLRHPTPPAPTSRTVAYHPVKKNRIDAQSVRDADVTIATWWETREWVEEYPSSKGLKGYFIRHYETFGGDPARVDATYRLPGMRFVIASWLQRLMSDRFGIHDAVLVPNGVDRSIFSPGNRSRAAVPTVGVAYSRLKWKGIDCAFQAIIEAGKHFPNLRTVAFGAHKLRRFQKRPERMTFEHLPARTRIAEIYRSADIWLMPSVSEGFGMPGLEAAACGCPVIATRCGGPEDYIVEGRNGYLVPVDDWNAMANRMGDILRLELGAWREMSSASAASTAAFDWDRSAEIFEQALM